MVNMEWAPIRTEWALIRILLLPMYNMAIQPHTLFSHWLNRLHSTLSMLVSVH